MPLENAYRKECSYDLEICPAGHEGQARLQASVRQVLAQVRQEYATIYQGFRYDVGEARTTFLRALAPSL